MTRVSAVLYPLKAPKGSDQKNERTVRPVGDGANATGGGPRGSRTSTTTSSRARSKTRQVHNLSAGSHSRASSNGTGPAPRRSPTSSTSCSLPASSTRHRPEPYGGGATRGHDDRSGRYAGQSRSGDGPMSCPPYRRAPSSSQVATAVRSWPPSPSPTARSHSWARDANASNLPASTSARARWTSLSASAKANCAE